LSETPDQKTINALVQNLRPKQAPKTAQSNGRPSSTTDATSRPSDSEVLEKLFGEPEGQKWRDIYSGSWGPHYGSQSSADAAILWKLAYWTDCNDSQMERLVRGSGLAREKWDSRRGGSTWLADEIAKAIENTLEGYGWQNARSRSHSLGNTGMSNERNNDLKHSIQALSFSGREKPAPREWVVDNSLWVGHATSWFGEGGVAKSLLALHLGLTVAAESRSYWMAFAVKTVPVLYLDFELDADEQHRRALNLGAGMHLDAIPENFYYLSVAMMPPEEAFKVAAEECQRLNIKLIIVDSVGFALQGDSENARDVLNFYRACIQPLKDAGASPLLIDHQAKIIKGEKYSDKQAFGSVYKTNAVRSSFQIRGSNEQGELTATFTHKKNNFGWKEKDFSLKIVFEEGRYTVERLEEAVPSPDREPSKKERVFETVEDLGRATAEMVAKETGIALQTVRNSISELLSEGELRDTGDKVKRSRIVVTHSHTTKGTGTGTKDAELFGDEDGHPSTCLCEECVPV
jgi:RecA-family ATPase